MKQPIQQQKQKTPIFLLNINAWRRELEKKRVAVAVGHTILTIVYLLLNKRQLYVELGADYFDRRKKELVIKQSIKRLEVLGCK